MPSPPHPATPPPTPPPPMPPPPSPPHRRRHRRSRHTLPTPSCPNHAHMPSLLVTAGTFAGLKLIEGCTWRSSARSAVSWPSRAVATSVSRLLDLNCSSATKALLSDGTCREGLRGTQMASQMASQRAFSDGILRWHLRWHSQMELSDGSLTCSSASRSIAFCIAIRVTSLLIEAPVSGAAPGDLLEPVVGDQLLRTACEIRDPSSSAPAPCCERSMNSVARLATPPLS